MLNIIFEHKILFFIIVAIIIINFICLIVLIIKERQADKKEIEGIVNELMDAKPREEEETKEISKEIKEVIKQEVIEEDNKKSDISSMLDAMKRDLEEKKNEDIVANFEAEQEERSIISYQELVNSLKDKNKKEDNVKLDTVPIIEIEDKSDIPVIEIDEKNDVPVIEIEDENLEEAKQFIEDNEDLIKQENEVKKKFKTTEFISPIYGKMENTAEYPTIRANNKHEMKVEEEDIDIEKHSRNTKYRTNLSLEETLNIEPLKEEIKKNDEFLSALKDFRKNLE